MAILVKICGLKTPGALEVALEAGADLVGFVFFPPSPRHLDGLTARALGRRVGGRARKVALPADPHAGFLAPIIEVLHASLAQLHRTERGERDAALKNAIRLPAM